MNSFSNGGILALSYFYDRISPLLPAPPKPKKKLGGIPDKLYEEEAAKHGGLREPNSMPISEIALLAQRVCDGPKSWEVHWGRASPFAQSFDSSSPGMSPSEASKAALDELQDRPEHCLDLTFMHALLRLGYEFGSERDVRFEKKVDDVELGWCLGATLAMVLDGSGDGIKCVA
ncbi:Guanosine-diphosphatase [Tulasnella sp. 419]|nr:Guanosine-diphosphatase [Tulasnella sp. 418]KAG8951073.1 Guanosine-diphosphatase [Tulasnella sp. 419]